MFLKKTGFRRLYTTTLLFLTACSFGLAQIALHPDYTSSPKKEWETKFDAFRFKTFTEKGHVLPYRFYVPENMTKGKKYPLVIFFHGAGEKGFDNRTQFQRFNPVEFWKKYPCFVLAPECPAKTAQTTNAESVWVDTSYGAMLHHMKEEPTWPMQLAISLIKETIRKNAVDSRRVYVTGLSMGGYATWEILQREGKWFAAAMPVCGGGDLEYAPELARIPIWVFHGAVDHTVPVSNSRDMVAAIRMFGGKPKYTEYPNVDHGAWVPTYSNPEVWDWLFQQVKK